MEEKPSTQHRPPPGSYSEEKDAEEEEEAQDGDEDEDIEEEPGELRFIPQAANDCEFYISKLFRYCATTNIEAIILTKLANSNFFLCKQ